MPDLQLVLPDGLEERFRDLRRRPKLRRELKTGREAAVERVVFGTAPALWIPEPPLSPPVNQPPPELVDEPSHLLAGLDAAGRPVLVRPAFGVEGEPPAAVVAHPSETVEVDGGHYVVSAHLLSWDGPRLEIVNFQTHDGVSHVTWVDHDGEGRPVRFARREEFDRLSLSECEWEGDRCVAVSTRWTEDGRHLFEERRTAEYDGAGLLRVHRGIDPAGARWHGLPTEGVAWERDRDGWSPSHLSFEQALAAWAAWLQKAVPAALPEDAAIAAVAPHWEDEGPWLAWAPNDYLEAVRRRADHPMDLLHGLADDRTSLGSPPPEVWRALRQHGSYSYDAPDGWADQLRARLGHGGRPVHVWGADAGHLVPLLRGGAAPTRVALPRSHDELLALLRTHDLPVAIAGQARWAAAIVARKGGGSRFGGPPHLPPGTDWPRSQVGRLTHIVSLDLSELPDLPDRDVLPLDGTLTFLADLTEEAALWDTTTVGEDERCAVLYAPAGTHLVEAEGRSRPSIRARAAGLEPFLMLPEIPEGLGPGEALAYDRLYGALLEVMPDHWMLGHPPYPLQDALEDGERTLLHVATAPLRVDFLDGGTFTLTGRPAEIASGRWGSLALRVQSA